MYVVPDAGEAFFEPLGIEVMRDEEIEVARQAMAISRSDGYAARQVGSGLETRGQSLERLMLRVRNPDQGPAHRGRPPPTSRSGATSTSQTKDQ